MLKKLLGLLLVYLIFGAAASGFILWDEARKGLRNKSSPRAVLLLGLVWPLLLWVVVITPLQKAYEAAKSRLAAKQRAERIRRLPKCGRLVCYRATYGR